MSNSKPLRILFWCPHVNLGGGARLLARLLAAVAAQPGIELVRCAAWKEGLGRLETLLAPQENLERFVIRSSLAHAWWHQSGRWFGIRGTGLIRRLLRRLAQRRTGAQLEAQFPRAVADCDLVYVFWPHHQGVPATAKPLVCTIHDTTLLRFPEISGGVWAHAEWRSIQQWIRRADRIVVPSRAMAAELEGAFGPIPRLTMIPQAICPGPGPSGSPAFERERLGLERYALYPANTTAHKNHANLLIAWSRLAQRRECPLLLCGEGTEALRSRPPQWPAAWQPARLCGIIARYGLESGADFHALGYVADPEVADLIAHATLLVMPSLAEGGGSYPVEEALAAGVPVACSDLPVMREHVGARSDAVVWFEPESPSSIVAAIERLFAQYDAYKRAALAASRSPRPSWDEIGARYAQVFRQTLEPRRS